MFRSAYETTITKSFNIKKTIEAVQEAFITAREQFVNPVDTETQKVISEGVYLINPGHSEIPLFTHPLEIEVNKKKFVAVDVRNFTRLKQDRSISITSPLDYSFSTLRGILTQRWGDELQYKDLSNIGIIPMRIFSQWITNIVTIRLGLTPDIQIRLAVIAAYYYYCLCFDDKNETFDEREKQKAIVTVTRATYADMANVTNILEPIEFLPNVDALVEAIKVHGNSLRYEQFNTAFLYTIINGSWFGSNAKEVLAVSLEHVPTWISLAWVCLAERGYKNTKIGQILYNVKSDEIDAFIRNVAGIIKAK